MDLKKIYNKEYYDKMKIQILKQKRRKKQRSNKKK